jgi:hypothetical protein
MDKQMSVKLAEALLRRKELQEKVGVLKNLKEKDLFEIKATRRQVTENIDDVVAQVPKLTINQVTEAFDWHARRLRLIDAAIQQANWSTVIEVDQTIFDDYKEKPEERK